MAKGGSSGGGGGGITKASLASAGVSSDLSPAELRRTWKATFGSDLTSPNQVRELAGVSKTDLGRGGKVEVSGNEYSKELNLSVTTASISLERRFTPGVVHHDIFFLDRSKQGGGAGSRILRTAVNQYQQLGIKTVKISAAVEVGRYVWPKLGFRVAPWRLKKYSDAFRTYAAERGLKIGKIHSVQQIANTVHNGKKLGKEFLMSNRAPNHQAMQIRTSRLARGLKEE